MQPGDLWLDDNGLMLYEPDPAKAGKQRTRRRYDQSDDVTQTGWLPAVTAPLTLLESRGVSYRLDVELARLEFEVHPYMTLEHQLAARLLCAFREYHRRAQLGLATFYANQLAALEDGLLNAREALFAAQEQEQDKPHQQEQVAAALVAMAAAERKVAEVRQLREEEDAALLAALEAMAGLWRQLGDVRERQRGLRLTDVGFSIVQLPHEDPTPLQADGLTRQQLDVALLVAEAENIAGLPPHPAALPLSQSVAELTSFALRRVESTASSHALLRAELSARLALLQDRVSADPDDPEMQSLHQQLQLLGPAPRRLLLSHQQEMQLWDWAEEEVTAGRVGVYRPPRLQPCLTVLPATPAGPRAAARLGSSGGTVSTSSARGAVAGDGSSPGPRSRLGWPGTGVDKQPGSPTADQQQQQHPAAASDGVVGLSDGQLLPISQQGPKLPVKLSYYARLLVNDRVVGTGEVLPLKSDYSLDFRDVFSLRLLKWPASMQLQIWEQGTFRDTLLCQFYLVSVGGAVDAAAAASAGHGSPVKSRSAALSGAGLAGSAHASPGSSRGKPAAGVGAEGPGQVFGNPLAHIGEDVEVAQRLAPPLPHTKADKALQRAAIGGHKGHRSAAAKWLSQELLDPNDPRNAALLELLRTRSAAASSGAAGPGGAPDLFRLDLAPELALAVDRAADQRVTFIKQRWHAGPYRGPSGASGGSMKCLRQLSTVAPLSARDTLELQDAYREALALVEAASLGLASAGGAGRASSAPAVTAALNGRQERALKWSQGALAKAIEAREAGIRRIQSVMLVLDVHGQQACSCIAAEAGVCVYGLAGDAARLLSGLCRSFALRVRAACNQLGSSRGLGRHFKTDDVVKDAPLPEFKLDLSSLAAALAPARPLRPQRRAVKKLQACVPRDTQLVITLQRASNLPRRLAPGGGGVRQSSPNRTSGAALPGWEEEAAAGFDDEFSAAGEAAGSGSSNSSLSCFVEVKFRGKAQRTAAVDSDMPMWYEQLLFPVIGLGQEASPAALKESDGLITVNLFDEVVTPTAAAKAARSAARAGQPGGLESLSEGPALPERERRFLGCLRVPLAAVYQAEVLAGAFKLDVPPVLLGYVQGSGRPPSLALHLSLQPRLAPPAEPQEERTAGEAEDVARHARKWVSGISGLPQCRGRVIKALAVDPEGVSTLLTRYLAPAPLPPALAARAAQQLADRSSSAAVCAVDHHVPAVRHIVLLLLQTNNAGGCSLEQLMLAAARWVAHVPFMDDVSLGKRRSNVWASNADFVELAGGDHEEHAHLLAGFFLELGQEGAGTLYSCDNVWANTQLSGHPWDISWALGDANCWRPFFGAVLPAREMACIQLLALIARLPTKPDVTLAPSFLMASQARSVVVTQPNNKLSRTLKALLKEVPGQLAAINAASMAASLAMADVNLAAIGGPGAAEAAKERLQQRLRLIQALQLSHNDRVAREMRGCLINGHILALPFSDSYAEAAAEAVLNTGLHRTVDPRVKFAMAAFVEPLGSAFVCCLWVYVAAIRETS
ncbi:hypothetical protein COO60DRAFT_1463007 [Scenedesmus sp. NREL 46B-D3]|nr:hypothetical protein COO60DRAFT_1463007 [Scenedesmus sp. NREL 46B-D3]